MERQSTHVMVAPMSVGSLLGSLQTQYLGRAIECYQVIDSTNRRALEWAREGAPEGALVLAEEQTAGRGRMGRQWHSPPGGALLISLILRPEIVPSQAQRVTMICSLGMVEAIERVAGLIAGVKWPNDVVIGSRKVGGILTELGLTGRDLSHVVVGMGINVNLDVSRLAEVRVPATSLMAEAGHPIPRLPLLTAALAAIEARCLEMAHGWSPHEEWRSRLTTLGTAVEVGTPEEVIHGTAVDVDADGALIVQGPNGETHRILAGDVTLRGHRT